MRRLSVVDVLQCDVKTPAIRQSLHSLPARGKSKERGGIVIGTYRRVTAQLPQAALEQRG